MVVMAVVVAAAAAAVGGGGGLTLILYVRASQQYVKYLRCFGGANELLIWPPTS